MFRILLCLLILSHSIGCASGDMYILKNSIGKDYRTVIEKLGPPDKVFPDGHGGMCYSWIRVFEGTRRERIIWADKSGKVYKAKW